MNNIRIAKIVKSRVVGANELIHIIDTRRDNIESARFVPPMIGENSFGKFKVVFRDKELING